MDEGESIVGKNFADFQVKVVSTKERMQVSEIMKGQATLLCFYSSWCGGCPKTIDAIDALCATQKYHRKVQFICVNINDDGDAQKMAIDRSWGSMIHVHAQDPSEYMVQYIPHLVLIAADGIVVRNFDGIDAKSMEAQLDEVLVAARKAKQLDHMKDNMK